MHTAEFTAITSADLGSVEDSGPAQLSARRTGLLVAMGGAAGALLRWGLQLLMPVTLSPTLAEFPWATAIANIAGCFAAGLVTALIGLRPGLPLWVKPLIVTGLCGGFTTLSAFALDVASLVGARAPVVALTYTLTTVATTLAAVVIGFLTGHLIGRRR